jgi:transcriptional regulator with XRE-family HTH domain
MLPSDVVRRQLRHVRVSRGLTQKGLAKRLSELGYPMESLTVARIEHGRMKRLSLDDVFAFAYALNVSPLFLMQSQEAVKVVPDVEPVDQVALRSWLRGYEPLPGQEVQHFNRELPPDELNDLRIAALPHHHR